MLLYQWYSLQQRQRQQQSRAKLKVNEIPLHRVCPYDRLKWHLLQYGSAILVTHTHTVSFRWRINGNISAHTHTLTRERTRKGFESVFLIVVDDIHILRSHTMCDNVIHFSPSLSPPPSCISLIPIRVFHYFDGKHDFRVPKLLHCTAKYDIQRIPCIHTT